ncbi:hypothetical protein NPS01_35920 [Nocardioides psychrotolerans]|uniref:Uncharacterized protein n=1 Tax=Nocardioides psychrotolerans TaxID=1005945 RepID=A0A1I3GEN2_9ACTN|nr:hypothetical protein [Nocardioides psychrotolerans]GEP39929.1 hypothetical protein NPS01_35920 [Nocardioides psychrotolerans]SFI21702.1 hypothetical protein SAMN05216561_10699 [Nocardioides psychrotolerans]
MSDDRELSPEQEERVRRLLAEARVEEPIPGDVAGRLDRVLARLADGEPDHDPAEVVELASRRRRKVTTLLVAAAVVVAVGVGASQLSPDRFDTSADSATSGSVPESTGQEELLDSGAAGSADAEVPAPAEAPPAPFNESGEASAYALEMARPTRIRPAFFGDDVARVRSRLARSSLSAQSPTDRGDVSADAARSSMCEPAAWGPGDLYVVRYVGNPAVLAFRPAAGDTQVVDLLQCGTADILRSVTLPGS